MSFCKKIFGGRGSYGTGGLGGDDHGGRADLPTLGPHFSESLMRELPVATRILDVARSELGRGEDPALGNNRGADIERWSRACGFPVGRGGAWCATFASFVLLRATSSTHPDLKLSRGAKRLVRNVAAVGENLAAPRPGALIAWNRGSGISWRGHVGICEEFNSQLGTLVTIEGNRGDVPSRVRRYMYGPDEWSRRLYRIAGLTD